MLSSSSAAARALNRLWPGTLSGRLALILVAGLLSVQALTGTVWYDMRYGKAMEIPTRLAAARLADTLRMLEAVQPSERDKMLAALSHDGFDLLRITTPAPAQVAPDKNYAANAALFERVLRQRLGAEHELRMLHIALKHDNLRQNAWFALLRDQYPSGTFLIQVRLNDGEWLQADASEGQAGMSTAPLAAAIDYLMRIYVLRIVAILLLAWMAVRLVMKPLNRLAAAADQLGRNIHSAPLATDGPTEVRKASLAFNAMQRRLIDNNAERTRFLAAVSHDLRSPITRMKLRTELLPSEAQRDRFRHDLDEMDALIGATLSMVQDSGVHEHPQTIDIDSLLLSLQSDCTETGGVVTIDGRAAPLQGYARSLKRCLQNVVENAVRYGGAAHIGVADTPASLVVSVSDNGPGIPDDLLERVLEPFYRLETSRNASTGGFGLGLSIAHTVALAHHGTLTLANGAGDGPQRGLIVTIILPRS